MNATLLKRLFTAIQKGLDRDVTALCERIAQEEKKRGHKRVALELEQIVREMGAKAAPEPTLSALPMSKREATPLVQVIAQDQLRHHMVLPAAVESRFMRVEKEYAARARLATFGLKARARILLCGPPGCGKSLGAERLAWATGLPMHKVRFDTLISSFFGETATNLRRVFEDAERRPCVLFLDECDTIARSRRETNDVGEVPRVVNMLLELLEDFRGEGLVIAASNLDDALDAAIFRRFDEVIDVPRPGVGEVQRLLKVTLSAVNSESGIDWPQLAQKLKGQVCSEVVKAAQNAAKRMVLSGRTKLAQQDIESAIAEIKHRH